ncbi:MAG: hypothetical protein M1834_002509 [Cirrosporium novae-zelandiae]|nr:MAG: hypothetical protein M1834_002509 [Cirrosporium novae-zelandiae]
MTSVDELFKKPFLPSNKRKLDQFANPNETNKSPKLSENGDVKGHHWSTVEEDDEDQEAGPELPPDEEGPIDEEDAKYFGGGITKETAEVLDYLEEQEQAEPAPEKIDSAWLRRLALNFEKRISKNAELRAKHEGDPQKFMGSEADLDADIKALSILSENPELYNEFAELGCVASLVSLLAHENTDIAIDAIEIISELTDEDVEANQVQWDALVNAMLDSDLLDLLVSNLARLEESNEADRSGVYHVLSVLENLASQNSIAVKMGQETTIISWLLTRIQRKESSVGQNKQYSAEILAILLQSSTENRQKFIEVDGIDTILQLLSAYRKRDPEKDSDEEEYVENVFDVLTCVVEESQGKSKFIEAEGVELCQIMFREGKMSKSRAARVLDHALGGIEGGEVGERLVEAAGLKTIFGMFMKKQDNEVTEHLLGIFSSLLRSLPGGSAARIRTLAKFVEKDYEKIAKLMKLRRDYASKISTVEVKIKSERATLSSQEQEDLADEWLSRRLDAGLFSLQTVDIILAWLIAEDDGAKARINDLFAKDGQDFSAIQSTLKEQHDGIADENGDESKSTKDMLGALLEFL